MDVIKTLDKAFATLKVLLFDHYGIFEVSDEQLYKLYESFSTTADYSTDTCQLDIMTRDIDKMLEREKTTMNDFLFDIPFILKKVRKWRGFDVEEYVKEKVRLINHFFTANKLDSIVIGISGGIDSAVVLALLDEASKQKDSPIVLVLPLSLPISNVLGVTGQKDAAIDAYWTVDKMGKGKSKVESLVTIDLENVYKEIVNISVKPIENVAWAEGQMASVLRTPLLYYHAAILQTQGLKSIVVGTTNRDEGAYIGFFGKASDAMVDLQPIADIHKSEVYQVAKYLGVTPKVIRKKPQGDVWDGRTDNEMIGASYDDVELLMSLKSTSFNQREEIGKERFAALKYYPPFANIEKLHAINLHKYQVGNPAHFIDVMDRKVAGGWK